MEVDQKKKKNTRSTKVTKTTPTRAQTKFYPPIVKLKRLTPQEIASKIAVVKKPKKHGKKKKSAKEKFLKPKKHVSSPTNPFLLPGLPEISSSASTTSAPIVARPFDPTCEISPYVAPFRIAQTDVVVVATYTVPDPSEEVEITYDESDFVTSLDGIQILADGGESTVGTGENVTWYIDNTGNQAEEEVFQEITESNLYDDLEGEPTTEANSLLMDVEPNLEDPGTVDDPVNNFSVNHSDQTSTLNITEIIQDEPKTATDSDHDQPSLSIEVVETTQKTIDDSNQDRHLTTEPEMVVASISQIQPSTSSELVQIEPQAVAAIGEVPNPTSTELVPTIPEKVVDSEHVKGSISNNNKESPHKMSQRTEHAGKSVISYEKYKETRNKRVEKLLNEVVVNPELTVAPRIQQPKRIRLVSERLREIINWRCLVTSPERTGLEKNEECIPTHWIHAASIYMTQFTSYPTPNEGNSIFEEPSIYDKAPVKTEKLHTGEVYITRFGQRAQIRSARANKRDPHHLAGQRFYEKLPSIKIPPKVVQEPVKPGKAKRRRDRKNKDKIYYPTDEILLKCPYWAKLVSGLEYPERGAVPFPTNSTVDGARCLVFINSNGNVQVTRENVRVDLLPPFEEH